MKTEIMELKDNTVQLFANTSAIIVAGGSSSRMGGLNKLMLEIQGIPVIARTLIAYQSCASVGEIVIAARQCDIADFEHICDKYAITKLKAIVEGGATRAMSVANAVNAASERFPYLAIADAARPLTTPELIDRVLEQAMRNKAAICAVPVVDTIKVIDSDGYISATPERSSLYAAQTPQIFESGLYRNAMNEANGDFTDDCALVESCGIKVKIAEGDPKNIKITLPCDIAIAEALLTEGKK